MAEPVSALAGRAAQGAVAVRDLGLHGMVTLRGDLSDAALRAVAAEVTGAPDFPGRGRIALGGQGGIGWMSPDELLLILPYAQAGEAVARIGAALAGRHHLAVDVSDARAVIALEGSAAREVLGKVTPADLHPDAFGPGDLRRTRIGQVAGAFWSDAAGRVTVFCFRSVADYVFGLLAQSAKDGTVGYY